MSEPFRVCKTDGWPDLRDVVAPNGEKFADGLAPIGAKAVADNLNAAWRAAGGPALVAERDELRAALETIVNYYVANKGTKHEFILCSTGPHASEMTAKQRKAHKVWSMFDRARALLARHEGGA